MKYIVFSDIHSNWEALEAFRKLIGGISHDKLIFLGDSVGYGTDPNPVVDWLRDNVDLFLSGNHDYAAVGKISTLNFNPYAHKSTMWTRNRLSEENKQFLTDQPCIQREGDVCWAHSSPHEPEKWHYLTSVEDGPDNFASFTQSLCFVGHTHRPLTLEQDAEGNVSALQDNPFTLKPDCRYIISVGSLGQPRDGNPEPAFVVYDSDLRTVQLHRFCYEMETTQQKISESDLPVYFAERLVYGM
ncbi:MAG: metallophosphoesterase family protein [Candidatus Nitrohelix vancouverensis]|uniref:Metallophosphoesterase family protein n=1 Tax=Candidatus Nitrohelix vancouverensis TaxID=2705534 RepID=A0A7T0C2Q5_9BACT|nr:MAG: metallophosphoesterase family protein [Candidatus Nitrohelix vancouverensis]